MAFPSQRIVHLELKFKNSQFPFQSTKLHFLTEHSYVFSFISMHACLHDVYTKESLHRIHGLKIHFPEVVLLMIVGVDRPSFSPNLCKC